MKKSIQRILVIQSVPMCVGSLSCVEMPIPKLAVALGAMGHPAGDQVLNLIQIRWIKHLQVVTLLHAVNCSSRVPFQLS